MVYIQLPAKNKRQYKSNFMYRVHHDPECFQVDTVLAFEHVHRLGCVGGPAWNEDNCFKNLCPVHEKINQGGDQ